MRGEPPNVLGLKREQWYFVRATNDENFTVLNDPKIEPHDK